MMNRLFTNTISLLVIALGLLPASLAFAGGIPDGPNRQITDAGLNGSGTESPHLVVRDNTVYAVWRDERAAAYNADMIYFAKSTDGGKTWGPNIRVSELPYDDWTNTPQIAVQPNGLIWVLWHTLYKDQSDKINDLRLALSADGGETFRVVTFLDGYDDSGDRYQPLMTVDESTGRVYILAHEYRRLDVDEGYYIDLYAFNAQGQREINEKTINDVARSGRGSFTSIGRDAPRMDLTARDGVVCAAWEDKRARFAIFGACSTDGGQTFSPNVNISGPDSIFPRIALAPDGTLYATYASSNDSDHNIWLRHSTDRGATWSKPRPVTAQHPDLDEVRDWDLAIDANGQIVVAWIDKDFSSSDLFLSTSVNQGINFARIRIEDGQGDHPTVSDQREVTLAAGGTLSSTRAYLAWRDDRNPGQQIWSQPVVLDGIAPTPPANVMAVPADTSILLTWGASADANGIRGYRIYRAPAAGGPFSQISPLLVTGLSYRDVEQTGTTWYYRIAAVDGTGNTSVPSRVVSAAGIAGTALAVNGTIAYVSGDNIMLRDLPALGNLRTLAQGKTPRFSANGNRLYYYSNKTITSKDISGGTAGGNPRIHLQNENLTSAYDLSADGTQIAAVYLRQFAAPGTPGGFCFVTEPHYFDQGQLRYVDEYNLSDSLALSAQGKWLVYNYKGFCNVAAIGTTQPPDFCIVNTATGEKSCISGADFDTPNFAPSGQRLAFSARFTGQTEIWRAEMQDNGALANFVQLTNGPLNQPSTAPAWSADGQWIIFQRDVNMGEAEDSRLFVVKADGSALRSLGIAGTHPAWSR